MLFLVAQTVLYNDSIGDRHLRDLPSISDRILLLEFDRFGPQRSGM